MKGGELTQGTKFIFLPVDICVLPLDYRYGLLKHFVNRKVWVGTDNQAHDAPSHNCTTIGAC